MDFMQHIDEEIDRRHWTRNELATRAGLSNSYFSLISSGARTVGATAATKIAHALGLKQETVYLWAGLLPGQVSPDPTWEEVTHEVMKLPPERRRVIIDFIHWQSDQNQRGGPSGKAAKD